MDMSLILLLPCTRPRTCQIQFSEVARTNPVDYSWKSRSWPGNSYCPPFSTALGTPQHTCYVLFTHGLAEIHQDLYLPICVRVLRICNSGFHTRMSSSGGGWYCDESVVQVVRLFTLQRWEIDTTFTANWSTCRANTSVLVMPILRSTSGWQTSREIRSPATWVTTIWRIISRLPKTRARPGSDLISWNECCSRVDHPQRNQKTNVIG